MLLLLEFFVSIIDLFGVIISGSEILLILVSKRSVWSKEFDVLEYCEFLSVCSWVFRFVLGGTCEDSFTAYAKVRFFLVWLWITVPFSLSSRDGIDIGIAYIIYFLEIIY